MKKKLIIIISLILLAFSSFIIFSNKENINTNEELESKTQNIVNTFTSEDLTYEKFINLIGEQVANVHIAVGPNSYLRNKPTEAQIKKYKLENYVNIQEELVKQVEKRYLDSLEYKVISTRKSGDEECQNVEISCYYYALYLYDLIDLTNSIVNVSPADASTNEKDEIEYYKGQVIALKVLDSHLDDYENTTKEKSSITVCYVNGKIKDSNEMLSFITALQGENYPNMNFSAEINVKRAQERLDKYLKEAANVKI